MGTGPFPAADAGSRHRHDAHWSAALDVDNRRRPRVLNFHPCKQRTRTLEVRFDR